MDFFTSYGLFLAKFATSLILLLLFIFMVLALSMKSKRKTPGKIAINNINDKYIEMQRTLQKEIMDEKAFKKHIKNEDKATKKQKKQINIKFFL